jgi:hypothetical protein
MSSFDEVLHGSLDVKEDKRVNVKDILNFIFQEEGIEQQTILSNDNINAIIKMQATNAYLLNQYGFKIDIFDTLIDAKRLNVISYKGRGRKDIIDAIKAMQDNNIIPETKGGIF